MARRSFFCKISRKYAPLLLTKYIKRCIIQSQARDSRVHKKGDQNPRKGGKAVDDNKKDELLEVLRKALESDAVERITITIKPRQKPEQPKK